MNSWKRRLFIAYLVISCLLFAWAGLYLFRMDRTLIVIYVSLLIILAGGLLWVNSR